MKTINYCIQCTDHVSGTVGTFAYDRAEYEASGKRNAVSPVCSGCVEFFAWAKANGWQDGPAYSFQLVKP